MKLNEKYKMMFFAPDDGAGASAGMSAVDDPPIPDNDEPAVPAQGEPTPPAAPPVDAAAIAKSIGSEIASALKSREDDGKKTKTVDDLTPEEAAKILNVWQPSKEWIAKFDNLDTREAALKELRDGVVKNSDTITQHRLKELSDAMDTKYGGVVEFMQNYQNEQTEKRFTEKYQQLADPTTMKIVKAVADDLVKNGKKFDDEASLFKALAEGTEAVIKVHNPNFKLSAGSNPATKTKTGQSSGSIPVTTPGAGGGTGGKGGDTAKPRGLAIFEK
jgi:hypothetical protein